MKFRCTATLLAYLFSFVGCASLPLEVFQKHLPDFFADNRLASAPKGETGIVPHRTNVRAGPSTSSKHLVTLPSGSSVQILSTEKNWHFVEASQAQGPLTGYIRADLVRLREQTVKKNTRAGDAHTTKGSTQLAGYSLAFADTRAQMRKGNTEAVLSSNYHTTAPTTEASESHELVSEDYLQLLEAGLLRLSHGDSMLATAEFRKAEDIVSSRNSRSIAREFAENVTLGAAALVTGDASLAPYEGEDYEKILTINLYALAQLLEGQRSAYNITRRAINYQQRAQRQFEEKRDEVEAALEKADTERRTSRIPALASLDLVSTIQSHYSTLESRATRLPSAYVNPFGYYLSGVIHEIESRNDTSLRDNARISYEKAAALAPKSSVLQEAITAMEAQPESDRRTLHVIAAVGFVPEKKILEFDVAIPSEGGAMEVPVKLPIWEPVEDAAHSVDVQSLTGKKLGSAGRVADIEALALRSQRDRLPEHTLHVILEVLRIAGVKSMIDYVTPAMMKARVNQTLGDVVESIGEPDTRAWLGLPKSFIAARVSLPAATQRVVLVSKSRSGKILSRVTVHLSSGPDSVVFARAVGNQITATANKELWNNK